MNIYTGQQAQEIITALFGEEPLPERLAIIKLSIIPLILNDQSLPDDVKARVEDFMNYDLNANPKWAARLLRHVVQAIFEETGRQDIRLGYDQFLS